MQNLCPSLDFGVALSLAKSLTTIGGFWTEDALVATAQDLMRWCRGAVVGQHVWSAETQADWLVTTARETWGEWRGTLALKALFDAKFGGHFDCLRPAAVWDHAAGEWRAIG